MPQWYSFPRGDKSHILLSIMLCFLFFGLTSSCNRKASNWKPNSKSFVQSSSSTCQQPLHAGDNRHPQFPCTSMKKARFREHFSILALTVFPSNKIKLSILQLTFSLPTVYPSLLGQNKDSWLAVTYNKYIYKKSCHQLQHLEAGLISRSTSAV